MEPMKEFFAVCPTCARGVRLERGWGAAHRKFCALLPPGALETRSKRRKPRKPRAPSAIPLDSESPDVLAMIRKALKLA